MVVLPDASGIDWPPFLDFYRALNKPSRCPCWLLQLRNLQMERRGKGVNCIRSRVEVAERERPESGFAILQSN